MSPTSFLTGRRTLAAGTVAAAFFLVASPAHAGSSGDLPVPVEMTGTGELVSDGGPMIEPVADAAVPTTQAIAGPGATSLPRAAAPDSAVGRGVAALPSPSGMPAWMLPAGLVTMLAGAVVVRTSRQKAALI